MQVVPPAARSLVPPRASRGTITRAVAPRIVGHYRLLSLIGRGATSEVYAAEHALLGDKVAVKLLRPERANDPGQTQALVEEGARVRGIDHANVVRVIDVGVDPAT